MNSLAKKWKVFPCFSYWNKIVKTENKPTLQQATEQLLQSPAYIITDAVVGLLPKSLSVHLPDKIHLSRALYASGYHLLESTRGNQYIQIKNEISIVEFILGFLWLNGCPSTAKVVKHISYALWCLDLLPHKGDDHAEKNM